MSTDPIPSRPCFRDTTHNNDNNTYKSEHKDWLFMSCLPAASEAETSRFQASAPTKNLSLRASSPGYGYVILPSPHSALFEPIGEHFVVSYLPEGLDPENLTTLTICLWLGPGLPFFSKRIWSKHWYSAPYLQKTINPTPWFFWYGPDAESYLSENCENARA